MCTFGVLGLSCEARAAPKPPGLTFQGLALQTHHQNSTKGPQEREEKTKIVVGEKKKREISDLPTLSGPTLRDPRASKGLRRGFEGGLRRGFERKGGLRRGFEAPLPEGSQTPLERIKMRTKSGEVKEQQDQRTRFRW